MDNELLAHQDKFEEVDSDGTKEENMRYIRSVVVALFFSLTVLLFCPSSGLAQGKEIISEGTYNMGDGETPSVAESRAVLQAKRIALEEAGTYVVSYSKIENLQLTADEIKVITAGLMEVTILDKKRTIVGDGINFWVKIKAIVQIEKMTEMAKRVKENTVVEDYKKIQEAYDKSLKEIEELKRQLAGAKGEKEKKQVEAKITEEERLFQAKEWFDKGSKYDINKEYDNAIEAFSKAIALDPNDAYTYLVRGSAYADKGQYDRAIEDYNKAIAIDQNDAHAYSRLGHVYDKRGQYDRAIEAYNKAIALYPLQPSHFSSVWILHYYYYSRGIAYAGKGQYDRAIEDYNKAIAIDQDDAFAYHIRGKAYAVKGEYDMAIEDYNKAIALTPSYSGAEIYYDRGIAYIGKGQYDKAIEDYNKVIAIDPNLAEVYKKRGNVYGKKNKYDRVTDDFNKTIENYNRTIIEDHNKAIALDPNDALAYIRRGNTYRMKEQYDMAIEDYNKVIALDPKIEYLGPLESSGAIENYSKGSALDQNDVDVDNKIGKDEQIIGTVRVEPDEQGGPVPEIITDFEPTGEITLDKKDIFDEITLPESDFEPVEEITLNPNLVAENPNRFVFEDEAVEEIAIESSLVADAYRGRGTAYAKKKQYDRAIEDFNKAIALDPNNVVTYLIRGAVYYQLGDKNRAISDFQKACAMGDEKGCVAKNVANR